MWGDTTIAEVQRRTARRFTHSTCFTSTTHRHGRARIDFDDDDGNGGKAAHGGDGIDWENIEHDDEE